MLVIDDVVFEAAVQQLRKAEFQECPWSYGSLNPDFYTGTIRERIYRRIIKEYSNLDQHSVRFLFPTQEQSNTKVVLLPTSYANIRVEHDSNEMLTVGSNIYYPNGPRLLRSFVQTLVREPVIGMWTSTLHMWSISYLYGELLLNDDTLDSCGDDTAMVWFSENIRRFSGGIDRVTCTERLGRRGYNKYNHSTLFISNHKTLTSSTAKCYK